MRPKTVRATRSLVLIAVLLMISGAAGSALGQGVDSAPAPEGFILSGVMLFDGGGGVAWLEEPTHTGNHVISVRTGESIGPYRLTRIMEDRVELEGPAGKVVVSIYSTQGGSKSTVAAASGARTVRPHAQNDSQRRMERRAERVAGQTPDSSLRRSNPMLSQVPTTGAKGNSGQGRGQGDQGSGQGDHGSGSDGKNAAADGSATAAAQSNANGTTRNIPLGDPSRNAFGSMRSGLSAPAVVAPPANGH